MVMNRLNKNKKVLKTKMKTTIRNLFAMILLSIATSSFAADNSIYIDQSGDNATVTITQDGAGNVVRGIQGVGTDNTTASKIYGNNNQVTISQIGSGNKLDFGIRTTVANGATGGNVYTYSITGSNATAIINSNSDGQGTSGSNSVDVTQVGNAANLNVNILGSKNSITALTSGGNNNSLVSTINGNENTQNVSMTGGGGNSATLTQTGTSGSINLTSVGATNTFTIAQSGGGSNGHSSVLDVTGSGNTYGITQSGTSADSIVNLKTVGSGNTFTINSNTH